MVLFYLVPLVSPCLILSHLWFPSILCLTEPCTALLCNSRPLFQLVSWLFHIWFPFPPFLYFYIRFFILLSFNHSNHVTRLCIPLSHLCPPFSIIVLLWLFSFVSPSLFVKTLLLTLQHLCFTYVLDSYLCLTLYCIKGSQLYRIQITLLPPNPLLVWSLSNFSRLHKALQNGVSPNCISWWEGVSLDHYP